MNNKVTIEHVNAAQWRSSTRTFLDTNYRQLWDFGIASAARRNAVSEHVQIKKDQQILGLADVRIKKLSGLGTGIAYVNGGPLVRQGEKTIDNMSTVLQTLIEEYVKRRKLMLRIQPTIGTPELNQKVEGIFKAVGFETNFNSKQYRTLLLDLEPGEESLMRNLAKQWRYNLRKAMKEEFLIHSGTGDNLFERFCELYDQFHKNKRFDVDLGPSFYARIQRNLPEEERMIISLAEKDGKLIAGHIFSILGDTGVNLFRAMTPEEGKTQISYLLQWNAIVKARQSRCRYYDMGGIDPDENPGVYSFKKGVRGEDVTAAGPYEYAPDMIRAFLLQTAEAVYRRIHK